MAGAIQQASQATGTSFNYLWATAKVGFRPLLPHGAATSSARGLFQFIQTTWLATHETGRPGTWLRSICRCHHSEIVNGQYEVRDPSLRRRFSLRSDPTANALMAGAFTKVNASVLSERLGRSPSEGELYIAHFLGAGGAARLLTMAAADPRPRPRIFSPAPRTPIPRLLRSDYRRRTQRRAGPEPHRSLRCRARQSGSEHFCFTGGIGNIGKCGFGPRYRGHSQRLMPKHSAYKPEDTAISNTLNEGTP